MPEIISAAASHRRVRRSAEEATALVEEWRSSGLSRGAFCQQRGIPLCTLSSCQHRVAVMHRKRGGVMAGFVEIRPLSSPAGLTLEIAGGFLVSGLDVAGVSALVSALRGAPR